MKFYIYRLVIISFVFLAASRPVNTDLLEKIKIKLDYFNKYYPQEKIYIHFDKPYYSIGEQVWFKTYLVDASNHRPDTYSKVIYVELIDPTNKLVKTKTLKVSNGAAAGNFDLNEDINPGVYTIRSYTNFMRNFESAFFFQKKINILTTDSSREISVDHSNQEFDDNIASSKELPELDLQFFPEGGHMVDGLLNYIAFKAVDSNGKSVDVEGQIIRKNRDVVSQFRASKFGMGVFVLKPEKNEEYFAVVNYNGERREYNLPISQPKGLTMHISDLGAKYRIMLYSNLSENESNDVLIIGQQRSSIFCNIALAKINNVAIAEVSKDLIGEGIAQFTVFNDKGYPLIERIVYNSTNHPKQTLKTKLNSESFQKRDEVLLNLSIDELTDDEIARMSISITDTELVKASPYANNIGSHLLLSSDLKGNIENPGYYFDPNEPERLKHLDNLMITQGWRRFTWNNILNDSLPILKYHLEDGLSLKGSITGSGLKSKTPETIVTLSSLDPGTLLYEEAKTNKEGDFVFTGLDFSSSKDLIIQANKPGTKERGNYKIEIDKYRSHPFDTILSSKVSSSSLREYKAYIDQRSINKTIDSAYNFGDDVIILEGIDVKATKNSVLEDSHRPELDYVKPSQRLDFNELPSARQYSNILEVIRGNVPGVVISGRFPNHRIVIRGMKTIQNGTSEPMYLLNGMPVDFNMLYNISPQEVDFVDILKGPSAAVYGIRGANGVIAVYTKNELSIPNNGTQGIINYTHPGFDVAKEFYAPKYDKKKEEHVKPDYRITLYWNPDIVLSENKKSQDLTFYTCDKNSYYQIEIQGITSSGKPIYETLFFDVK